jgi:hypothetical protein
MSLAKFMLKKTVKKKKKRPEQFEIVGRGTLTGK